MTSYALGGWKISRLLLDNPHTASGAKSSATIINETGSGSRLAECISVQAISCLVSALRPGF